MEDSGTPDMTSNRPYLLRALYEWIQDNGMTPHVLVDASVEGVDVPASAVRGDKVVLNLAPQAVRELNIENDWLFCVARFSGRSTDLQVPVAAVLAIYAKENGQGMMFAEPDSTPPDPDDADEESDADRDRSHLTVIK